jgi:uncharacterized protein involved in outer membrane biogenesis
MRRALVILGVLVFAALAGLFAVPAMIDWDRYRGAIEEEASRLAGREVRIGGQINVRLLPVPYIHIGRLRIADTTAAIGEPLFKADALTVWLALSPLVSGAIEARRVELTAPVLNLVLDGNGSGNWASLTSRAGGEAAPLPPRVTFDDIKVSDGALVIREPNGNIKSQFQKIAGNISAAALEGPYRVNLTYAEAPDARAGTAASQSARDTRELRLSTARQDPDGSVRFKGTVRVPTRNQSWAIDATAHDLLGRLRIDGSLTARTPFVRSDPVEARNRTATPAMVEIKSTLKADTASAELSDLTLTLDADNKPQLAQGAAKFTWRKETTAEILINARWIDVDRILGTDANTASTATLARIISGLGDALPGTDQLRALLLLDQATLNGDVISALKLDVQKSGADGYDIREFSGNLPGSARLVLSGKLTPGAPETEFEGPLTLRGASFNRFVAWAGRGRQAPEIARDGPFALDGRLAVGPRRIAGQSIRLELPGGRLAGDASWKLAAAEGDAKAGAGAALSLALDGPSFDFGALLPSEPRPGALIKSLVTSLAFPTAAPRADTIKAPGGLSSMDIKLRFGRLATQAAVYHDVDAELAWDGRTWHVPRLKASGAAGWQVELEGGIASADDADPAGTIAGVVISPDRVALADLLAWLDVPATGLIDPQRLDRISPLRLAGRLQLSPKGLPGATRLSLDGSLGENRLSATLTAPKRAATLTALPLEIDLTGDVPAITTLISQIAPDGWSAPAAGRIAMPARLTLSAVGSIGEGFETLAALDSPGARAELRGRLSTPAGAMPELKGVVRLSAEDLANLVAATALGRSSGLAGVPLVGRIGLQLSDKRLKLESDDLALADARVRGSIDLDFSKTLKRLDARLSASRVDLSRALIPVLDERPLTAVTPEARAHTSSWWPEAPFDLDRLDGVEGTIAIDTPEFVIASGITLRAVRLESTIRQSALDIRLVEAAALGGKANARVSLAKAPAGAALKGNVRIDGAELADNTADGQPSPLSGRLQLSLDVTGAALTARGLIASLSGTGEVRLTDGVLSQLSPGAIVEASEAVLAPQGSLAPGQLEKAVRERLGTERISLGRRRIPLAVADGHVRTAPIVAESKAGRVTGTTILDLDTQRVDSEWKIDGANVAPRPGAKPRGPLPAVTVIWAGALVKLASLAPQVHVDALERELSVRRMEGEVDELERVRRLDEDRARQEAERQRTLEAERLKEVERSREAERARENLAAPPQGQSSPWQPLTTPTGQQPGGAQAPAAGPAASPAAGTAQGEPAAVPPPQAQPKRKAPAKQQPFNPFSSLWGN